MSIDNAITHKIIQCFTLLISKHKNISLIININFKMHKNQKLRLIQQICFMLQFPQPAVSTVLQFYRKFEAQVTNNQYANEVIVCSCVFLVSKIFEDERKIRDILNVINSAIKMYQIARVSMDQQNQNQYASNYINLDTIVSDLSRQTLLSQIQPAYDLQMYNQLKKQVLEAQQVLLKILAFDFSIAEQKSSNYKQLLGVCDQLRLPWNVIQVAVAIYNDLEFSDIIQWVPGIIFFAVQVNAVYQQQISQQSGEKKSVNEIKISEQIEKKQREKQKKEEDVQQLKIHEIANQKKESVKSINKNAEKQQKIEWQKLFLVPIKKLEVYSQKIVSHYQKLSKQEYQEEEEVEMDKK